MSDVSDHNIEIIPSPKIQQRKERKKRSSTRKATKQALNILRHNYETDKVCIQGYAYFDDDFNIDKIC